MNFNFPASSRHLQSATNIKPLQPGQGITYSSPSKMKKGKSSITLKKQKRDEAEDTTGRSVVGKKKRPRKSARVVMRVDLPDSLQVSNGSESVLSKYLPPSSATRRSKRLDSPSSDYSPNVRENMKNVPV